MTAPDRRPGRGNTTDRARRHAWLLVKHGDGITCPCWSCGALLTAGTVLAERIDRSDTYRRSNIRAACRSCVAARGGQLGAPQAPAPHTWPCRHCDMVADYRLHRAREEQLAEGAHRQDEEYRPITFGRWLRHFPWPRPDDQPVLDPAAVAA